VQYINDARGSGSYVWYDSQLCETWHICMWDMTRSYVGHDPLILDVTYSYVRHDPLISGTWPIHMLDMTHAHKWHDSFICGTWRIYMWDFRTWCIHMWDMMHSYVGLHASIRGTGLIKVWDMTHSYVGHDSFVCFEERWVCDAMFREIQSETYISFTQKRDLYDSTKETCMTQQKRPVWLDKRNPT